MNLPVTCKTSLAVLLVAVPDEKGVMRFPSDNSRFPGLLIHNNGQMSIQEQLIKKFSDFIGDVNANKLLKIYQNFDLLIESNTDDSATLYLGIYEKSLPALATTWSTFPELLRNMKHNKARILYLKAWQVFMGGLTHNIKVVEEFN